MEAPSVYEQSHELRLLEALEADPETTQADLAARVGVAVGTVNWYMKRWAAKGFVKVRRMGRWNWHYLLTTQGVAEKARLAASYLEVSMALYRQTRQEARRLLLEVKSAGFGRVALDGDGEMADICRLTCLELGLTVVVTGGNGGAGDTISVESAGHAVLPELSDLPLLRVDGTALTLHWPLAKFGDGG